MTVLARLEGPTQSWGTTGRYAVRPTDGEPSRSGVLGLVCAAMGVTHRASAAALRELASLRMAVRVDREGTVFRDFHTVEVPARDKIAVTERYYLAWASFVVALSGEVALVEKIYDALRDPAFPLFLGRRACLPSTPVLDGVSDHADPESALAEWPWPTRLGDPPATLRVVAERDDGYSRPDVPVSFDPRRRQHALRRVATTFVANPNLSHRWETGASP